MSKSSLRNFKGFTDSKNASRGTYGQDQGDGKIIHDRQFPTKYKSEKGHARFTPSGFEPFISMGSRYTFSRPSH